MDFELTTEQRIFQKEVRRFVEKEVEPIAEEVDQKEEIPKEIIKKMGELGFYGLKYPEKYGGQEQDTITHCICLEEVARGSLAVAAVAGMHAMAPTAIYYLGTEEQKQKYLPPTWRGEKFPCLGLTEPNAGSDLSLISTMARREGDEYVINGSKTFTSFANIADYIVLAARTDDGEGIGKGLKGVSLFVVERGTPGFTTENVLKKLGTHGADTGEPVFTDCRVPKGNLIGEEGSGLLEYGQCLNDERVFTAALALGVAQTAYETARKHARERVQFGKPIGKFEGIKFKIVDMATRLEAARLLVYSAAWLGDQKKDNRKLASMAKVYATEMANWVASEALNVHGGYGYMMEYPLQRYFRDARFLLFGGGTPEIQRLIIGKELGL